MVDVHALASSIVDAISNTLSPDAGQRRAAEAFLSQREADTAEFPFVLLQLIADGSVPNHVRQAAAVYLKNVTGRIYSSDESPASFAASYDRIKASLVDIMLTVPPPIRRPLGKVLSAIAERDHPTRWSQLVPSLTERLTSVMNVSAGRTEIPSTVVSSVDWASVTAILETLHAIFERYPDRMRSDELYSEINHSLKHSQNQVLNLFQLVARVVEADLSSRSPNLVRAVFTTAEALCRVFYCLSWQDLPEFFEDHIGQYMTALRQLLAFFADAADAPEDDEPGPLDAVHAAVLEIANLYATKYDEEFRPYLPQFMSDAWALLMRRGNAPRYDLVVTTGIKFLSSIARSPDAHLFGDPSALSGVCNRIVIPNIQLRDEDAEMFEDDPREYIRHDLEGSDTGTRRRGAVELVKALCVRYEKEVTEIFSSYVQSIFSPETDWRKRDTAIYLVIALGWKTGTLMHGVTETSSLIDIGHFFRSFVILQLYEAARNPAALASPIFTADLIKFVIAFRHQIPIDGCKDALATCSKLLSANEPVVRTYAAACVERTLTMKTSTSNGNGVMENTAAAKTEYRIAKEDVIPLLPSVLPPVTNAVKSNADEYMMRLMLRLCTFCRDGMGPHLDIVLPTLVELLGATTANPANPLFNHYLFETFAALLRFNANEQSISAFENGLMTPLCNILISDVTEFGPYVFQIYSQMMSVHRGNLPNQYTNMMNPTLNPTMWERRAYTSAMVLYIETYIRRAKDRLLNDGQLEPTLGVFQKLIASKATDHHGLHLLTTLFDSLDLSDLSSYVHAIFSALLLRLSRAKTAKYVNHLLSCLSTFVLRFGVESTRTAFDGVERNILATLLRQVWLVDVTKLRNSVQRKLCALALSELSCGSNLCMEEPYLSLWRDMVTANVALAEGIVADDEAAEDEALEEEEDAGVLVGAAETYASTQSQLRWGLHSASRVPDVAIGKDPRAVLFLKVSTCVDRHKESFGRLFQEVSPEVRKAIYAYEVLVKKQ